MSSKVIKDSPIGIGCAYLTAGSLTKYDERLINAVIDEGALHFDVAPQYGLGTAEKVLGRAVGKRRREVSITTKVGIIRPYIAPWKLTLRGLLEPIRSSLRQYRQNQNSKIGSNVERNLNFEPSYIEKSINESLSYLKTDFVDTYLLHMPRLHDINDEVIYQLQKIKQAGKTNAIGLATDREETKKILERWPDIFDVVQYSWSILDIPLDERIESPFLITHRALSRAYLPLVGWLHENPELQLKLSKSCDADLSKSSVLSQALIGAAMVENAKGQILIASHSIERNIANIRIAKDHQTKILGERLLNALRVEQGLPLPKE